MRHLDGITDTFYHRLLKLKNRGVIRIGFVQIAIHVSFVIKRQTLKMPPKRILYSEWPLYVERNFKKSNLKLVAARQLPRVSEKYQSEIHKYVLELQNDQDVLNLDEELISTLNQLLNTIFESIRKHYDKTTQVRLFGQINFTCQGK